MLSWNLIFVLIPMSFKDLHYWLAGTTIVLNYVDFKFFESLHSFNFRISSCPIIWQWRSENNFHKSFLSTLWVHAIELRTSDLLAYAFTHWAISSNLLLRFNFHFLFYAGLCVCVFACVCVNTHVTYVQCLQRPEWCVRCPGIGVISHHEMIVINLGSRKEQQELLTTELSPQPHSMQSSRKVMRPRFTPSLWRSWDVLSTVECTDEEHGLWGSMRCQQIKVLALKPDNLSSMPSTHSGRETQTPQAVLFSWLYLSEV